MSSHINTAKSLIDYMQTHGGQFYGELDEFFRVSILTRALASRGVFAQQCRTAWSNQEECSLDWVLHSLLIEGVHLGPSGEEGLLACASCQVSDVDMMNGWVGSVEIMSGVLISYSKPGSDFRSQLLSLVDLATAFLVALDLQVDTPPVKNTGPPRRI